MKNNTHPEYNNVKVSCSCGHHFETRSTGKNEIKLEVCSECHPFYTGKQKVAAVDGRIDKFNKRYGKK